MSKLKTLLTLVFHVLPVVNGWGPTGCRCDMVQDVIKDARQDASEAVKILRGDCVAMVENWGDFTLTYLEMFGNVWKYMESFGHSFS